MSDEENVVVLPNQCIIKTWHIKNTGSVDWPEGVTIGYVGNPSNLIGNDTSFPVRSLKVGEEGDISIPIEAQSQPGSYQSSWQLMNSDKKPFGAKLLANVCVVDENNEQQFEFHPVATEEKNEEMKKLLAERENLRTQLEKVDAQLQNEKVLASKKDQVENDNPLSGKNETYATTVNQPMESGNGIEDQSYEKEIEHLLAMGFGDEKLLRSLLKQYNGNVDSIVEVLS